VSRVAGRIRRAPVHNGALRDHVTRVGFDLTLGRSHIAALVFLNEALLRGEYINSNKAEPSKRRIFALFAHAMGGCITRGLVIHHFDPSASRAGEKSMAPHYTITRAGELVVELLRETGLYEEYAVALPPQEAAS
jgi:hypothetical protein